MNKSRKVLLAQIDEMSARLAGDSDAVITQWADEIVKDEAKTLEESTGIPVRDKMDFSDQNTKMSSVAEALIAVAKSMMGEESEGDKQVDEQYEDAVVEEDKAIGASIEERVASQLVRLASAILADDDEDDDEDEDDAEEAPKAKKSAEDDLVDEGEKTAAEKKDLPPEFLENIKKKEDDKGDDAKTASAEKLRSFIAMANDLLKSLES
jgi:hypothetical protein